MLPLISSAGLLVEMGGVYLSDTANAEANSTSTKNFYDVGILFNWNKKLWAGWGYMSVNTNDRGEEKISFAGQDTGPMLKWQFGRSKMYSITGAFNILAQATYTKDGEVEKWRGFSYYGAFAVMPEVADNFRIGAAVNYYSGQYSKKTVDGEETTDRNSKTWIFPTLLLTKSW
jgi:hypothetical protein